MDYSVVILAGGKGKRMKSEILKPLIPLRGKRMIEYVVETFKFAGINDIIVVSHPLGKEEISNIPGVTKVIVQNEALGTFHALSLAISEVKTKYVFVTPADKPLLSSIDVKKVMNLDDQLIYGYESDKPKAVLVLSNLEGSKQQARIERIAEDPDDIKANLQEKYRTGGVYCFRTAYIAALECDKHITRINKNNEYYLTDVIPLLVTKPLLYEIEKKTVANINTPEELEGISGLFTSNIKDKIEELEQVAHARLNLMGRHIDHQGGFTNVILLNQSIKATIRPRTDLYNRYILSSKYGICYYEPEVDELPKDSLVYLAAPIKYLVEKGYKLSPCSTKVEGNIYLKELVYHPLLPLLWPR